MDFLSEPIQYISVLCADFAERLRSRLKGGVVKTHGKDVGLRDTHSLSASAAISTKDGVVKTDGTDVELRDTHSLSASAVISRKGGVIKIDGTGVELHIPPNAFKGNQEEQKIELRILPHRSYDKPSKCFEDFSTVMAEVLPNNLTLRQPASLFLPHCLKLKNSKNCKVRVFHSHHEADGNIADQKPLWKDITHLVSYSLSESCCEINLKEFCWITYSVRGSDVEAKKIMVYALGENWDEDAEYVIVDVGCYPSLPGENGVYKERLQWRSHVDLQPFLFYKEPQVDLTISLVDPCSNWKICENSTNNMTISYVFIESSMEQSCPFSLQRNPGTSRLARCAFQVFQEEQKLKSSLLITFTRQTRQCLLGRIPVTESIIRYLSKKIIVEWQYIGRLLNVPDDDLDRISADNEHHHQEKVYQMLQAWRRREGQSAHIGILTKALRNASRTDLADQLRNGSVPHSRIQYEINYDPAGGAEERQNLPNVRSGWFCLIL